MNPVKTALLALFFALSCHISNAQSITGVWKGSINNQKVEVKIIQQGDILTGSSYYYGNKGSYRRFSIRGYFDPNTNAVTWWDDELLEDQGRGGSDPMLLVADFNCPGDGTMSLEGQSSSADQPNEKKGSLDLSKSDETQFPDEWDFVIDNYTLGANNPDIIDSIGRLSKSKKTRVPERAPEMETVTNKEIPVLPEPQNRMVVIPSLPDKNIETADRPVLVYEPINIETKFIERKKVLTKEILVTGDSVELRFYDNAEVDGDSITLFLNGKMIFTHIKLGNASHVIKLAVSDLAEDNELIMVAENLGSIPPNTAYMLAIVSGERFEAYLSSTEEASAMIRLKKPLPTESSQQ
jgi:hypothetical protein